MYPTQYLNIQFHRLFLILFLGYTGTNAWSVERFVGYIFMPVSFIMGVPWEECEDVGRLIGIKTIINEFAAFKELGKLNMQVNTKLYTMLL